MKLVVIIPALNEQQTVAGVITAIPRTIAGINHIEAIVIDDGSADSTAEKARAAGAAVISHQRTMGVGAAFHTGISEALRRGADIIVNIDADAQFDPADIPALLKPILDGRASFVSCSRFARPDLVPRMPAIKLWGNRWVIRIVNLITGKKFTDVSCGFRAYTRDTAMRLNLFGHFTYTQETLIDLAYKGVTMAEVPLKVRGVRPYGKSRVASNLWRYAVKSAIIMFRAAKDYQPIYFFGIPGFLIFLAGLACATFVLIHFLQTGQTSPYRSLVTVSGTLVIVGFLLLFQAMLADMMYRNRVILERTLYLLRKQEHSPKQ